MAQSISPKFENIVEKAIDAISDELHEISLKIHDNPELSLDENFAHKILTDYLETKGFIVKRHAYGLKTAFRAEFENTTDQNIDDEVKKGRTISFNSEYDALPGIGHACGHNLIAISGVGAAYGVKCAIETLKIPGKVVLFGTPAEEKYSGKAVMISAGAYKDVDICMMVHPAWADTVEPVYLAIRRAEVEYFGKASHAAASPWEGINALDAAVQAYNALSMLRQQIQPFNRIHGIITNGGKAANIIPDYASLSFYIRSTKKENLAPLQEKVNSCFVAAAEATGCKYKINWTSEILDVLQNHHLRNRFEEYMSERGVKYIPNVVDLTGSTDMGNVSYVVPAIHALYNIGKENTPKFHTIEFEKLAKSSTAHARTMQATKCLALTALDVLTDDQLFREVRKDFEDCVGKDDNVKSKI
ncbi:11186_t:CDS:10 [Ambispora leptoticha]|uniref:Peptidase M20 domain-containing protein 2 n=1 Tax=Ambispora leptoticha TaxID=144679 RepID=A0A9N8VWK0_9GLOM|nr:11186_t:CDS:10 [Ambispora leptoticha]